MVSAISRALFAFVGVGTGLYLLTLGVVCWMCHGSAIRADLSEDWQAIRGRGLDGWVFVVIETVLSLGLLVRACCHTLVYLTSGLAGRPDVSLGLRWSPLSGRPVWNEWTARLFTAVCGLWFVQSIHLAWGWPPLIEQTLRIAFTANAAVLVGDPAVGAAQRLLDSTMFEIPNTTDRGDA
jgi:hypothetical protein